MKTFLPLFILISLSISAGAQLINQFSWDTNPVTTATYGPNAISISSYASSVSGGTKGTSGLNPGNGRYDINLVLDGSYFNVPAIDISVDFRREESVASFFYRGTFFNFGMSGGALSVNFLLANGAAFTTVNSGNILNVADDHAFHNYRFYYDNNNGTAKVLVDGIVVYTYTGTAGVPMYWTGAGNVTIGKDMDANGNNITVLDNLVIQKYSSALLPLKLLSFTATAKNNDANISFTTTEETKMSAFVLERSSNGLAFSDLTSIAAVNGYGAVNHYQFTDSLPFSPVSYYRLKMLNTDGTFSYSAVKSVSFSVTGKAEVTVYPNPAVDYVIIKMNTAVAGKYLYTVTGISGQAITASTVQLNNGAQQIKIDLSAIAVKGVIVIKLSNVQTSVTETFTIIKK